MGEDRGQLRDDIGQMKRLAIELVAALVADPEKGVALVREAPALDDEADGVRRALRRMGRVRRQEEDFALPNRDVDRLSLLQAREIARPQIENTINK